MVRDVVRRRRSGVLLAAATAAGLLVGSSTSAPSASALVLESARADQAAWVKRYNDRVVSIVNARRTEHGLPQVKPVSCAGSWARSWSSHLASEDLFEHSDMSGLLEHCDADYASENIAMIYDGARPATLVKLWMNSPGHRANILSRKAKLTGVSVRWDDSRNAWIAVQNFVRR